MIKSALCDTQCGLFAARNKRIGIARPVLLNLYQFNVEIQVLTGHLVIGVKGNGSFITGAYHNLQGLTIADIQHDLFTHVQTFAAGQLADRCGEDGAGIGITVCLIGSFEKLE